MGKEIRIVFIVLSILFSIGLISAHEISVSECGILSEDGAAYILINNINSNNDCFKITGNEITLDGNGFSIMGDGDKGDYGVYSLDSNNIEIKNLTISNFYYGIYFDGMENSSITNNNLIGGGIKLIASNNVLVSDNSINNGKEGILITTGRNNWILNNNLMNNEIGMKLSNSHYNIMKDNFIIGSENGFYLLRSSNNEFSNSSLMDNDYGIYLDSSTRNSFRDLNVSSVVEDVTLISSSYDNNFISSNQNSGDVDSGSKLIRKWYLDIRVTDGLNFTDQAKVTLWNADGQIQFSSFTNESGDLRKEVIDYVNNGRKNFEYNDYTLKITKGDKTFSQTLRVHENIFVGININLGSDGQSSFPISNISTNPLLPLTNNGSSENLLINFDSELYPLNISILLFKQFTSENESFSLNIYSKEIINKSDLPLSLIIPGDLQNGTYSLNITIDDPNGNKTLLTLGFIEVQNMNPTDENNAAPIDNGGNGGGENGGGSSSSGGGGGSTYKAGGVNATASNNLTNNTIVLNAPNSTNISKINDTNTNNKPSPLTGAVIGALQGKGKWIALIILIIIVIVGYIVLSGNEPEKESNGKNGKKKEGKDKEEQKS